MIKSVHRLYVPRDEARFNALVDLFDSLGLRRGESWKGKRTRGIKLEAGEAGVEIGMGTGFPAADLVVEVDSADAAYELAGKRGWKIAEKIADADWGARLFTISLPAGLGRVCVFSYNDKAWRGEVAGEGKLDARGKRFGVVAARFNAFISERLLAGALDALRRTGAEPADVQVMRVPGSFEIPQAARQLAASGRFHAIICLGCLLRGETAHYEVIANEVTRGIGQSAQETGVPHAFGVLTCDTLEQAIDRAGLKGGNQGFNAALAAVEMANVAASGRTALSGKVKSSRRARGSRRGASKQASRSRKRS